MTTDKEKILLIRKFLNDKKEEWKEEQKHQMAWEIEQKVKPPTPYYPPYYKIDGRLVAYEEIDEFIYSLDYID